MATSLRSKLEALGMVRPPCEIEIETGVILDGDIDERLLVGKDTPREAPDSADDTECHDDAEDAKNMASRVRSMYTETLSKMRRRSISAAINSQEASAVVRAEIKRLVVEALQCGDPMTTPELSRALGSVVGAALFPAMLIELERAGEIRHVGRLIVPGKRGRGHRVWQSVSGKSPVSVDGRFSRFPCGKVVTEEPEYDSSKSL